MNDHQASAPPQEWFETAVMVSADDGLHARPAIRLSQLARTFSSAIRIGIEGQDQWVDVKSVARLVGLRVDSGRTVLLRASGEDAAPALAALRELIRRDFGPKDDRG